MSVLPVGMGSSGVDVGDIGHSLRLRASASAYVSKTFGTPTDREKWSVLLWIKRGTLGVRQSILCSGTSGSQYADFRFSATDKLEYVSENGGLIANMVSTRVFRDPSAHIPILLVYDQANGTSAHKLRMYIEADEITTWDTATYPSMAGDVMNYTFGANIGRRNYAGDFLLDSYISRIAFVDGQALTPSSFGYQNTEINEWVSKSQSQVLAVVEAGGTNSFMLDFDDATSLTTLGYDKSTKNNDWTLSNVSLTAGVTYDHMLDVPGNSFATLNPLQKAPSDITLSAGNLEASSSFTGDHRCFGSTMAMTSGQWYWEALYDTGTLAGGTNITGCFNLPSPDFANNRRPADSINNGIAIRQLGDYESDNSVGAYFGVAIAVGDVIGAALDATAGTIKFNLNGGAFGSELTFVSAGGVYTPGGDIRASSGTPKTRHMFGQAPLHASATFHSAAGGYFRYTPPTGYKARCQANMPEVNAALLDPTDHHIDIAVTKSGDTNFTLPWDASVYDTFFEIKRRNAAGDWYQIDGLRGYTKILKSNSTAAETTDANVLGVSGTTCTLKSTLADGTYIVSATKAGLSASRQTNTAGSITSTVSRNVDSGFSIVTYTSPNNAANQTVGHGLGAVTKMIVVKNLDNTFNWDIYHHTLSSGYGLVYTTAAASASRWTTTAPTTTVFSTLNTYEHNSTHRYVAYCYADSAIQKSFSYTGNGSADGPYVNLGFKLGTLTYKRTDSTSTWTRHDSVRNTSNTTNLTLRPNADSAENTSGEIEDLVAYGFKCRSTDLAQNASGGTYIGQAWATTTGKFSNAR